MILLLDCFGALCTGENGHLTKGPAQRESRHNLLTDCTMPRQTSFFLRRTSVALDRLRDDWRVWAPLAQVWSGPSYISNKVTSSWSLTCCCDERWFVRQVDRTSTFELNAFVYIRSIHCSCCCSVFLPSCEYFARRRDPALSWAFCCCLVCVCLLPACCHLLCTPAPCTLQCLHFVCSKIQNMLPLLMPSVILRVLTR